MASWSNNNADRRRQRRSTKMSQSTTTHQLVRAALLLCSLLLSTILASSPASGPTILRIRLTDGSMTRVAVPKGKEDSTTLSDILSRASPNNNDKETNGMTVKVGQGANQKDIEDKHKSISELGLKHGTLVTLVPHSSSGKKSGGLTKATKPKLESPSFTTSDPKRFDPFPTLAKPSAHSAAARRLRALAHSARGQSYDQISKLREYMHNVEPQPEGSIKRIYMCTTSADRFKDGCTIKPTKKQIIAAKKSGTVDKLSNKITNRMGLLFGTIGTERVDQKKDKVRTSLSTPLYEREMCNVAKVQALWEPMQPKAAEGGYDASRACKFADDKEVKRALRIGDALGLRPVGWIYSYSQDRHAGDGDRNDNDDEDSLPVYASDIYHGAVLQIGNMKSKLGREEGKKFVTLALDARSGATEAFQLSDVSVQMVAEALISPPSSADGVHDSSRKKGGTKKGASKKKGGKKKDASGSPPGRYVTTTEKFLVDSEETTELDSVLCLVNTALLGHTGTFCGKQAESLVNKKGQLTAKAKKRILTALEKSAGSSDDVELFETLCDFNVLLALDEMLSKGDMDELCRLVRKWARGQRRGTEVGKDLRLALQSILM